MKDSFNHYQYDDLVNRENDPYAKAKYQILLDYLEKKGYSNLDILNAGCGSGDLSILLAKAGHKVVGIDPSEEYIELARKRVEQSEVDCEFRVESIKNLSDKKFDCVIATDVLEHIKDDYGAMEKLSFVTRPTGLIIITVPALQTLFGYHDEQLGHFRRYNSQNLKRLISSPKGVKIVKLRYFGFTLIPICYLFSCLLRRPYPMGSGEKKLKGTIQDLILNILLNIDRLLPLFLGTSLICFSRKSKD